MFYFWKLPHVFVMSFDVFDVFATSANETGNGYETVEMNSHVVNSPFTVGSFYWLKGCMVCIVPLPFARRNS